MPGRGALLQHNLAELYEMTSRNKNFWQNELNFFAIASTIGNIRHDAVAHSRLLMKKCYDVE
jgi:hypothetical protein